MKSTGNAMRLIPHPKKSIFLIKLGGYVRFCFCLFFSACFALSIS